MATVAIKFTPSVTPETWMTPTNGCRLSTLLTAGRFQCLDERFRNPSGKAYTKTQRTKIMKRLRYHAAQHRGVSTASLDGFNRDDALYAYRIVFPWGDAESFSPTLNELRDALEGGYFISLSGNTKHTSADCPLRRYVNPVDHEIGLARFNKSGTRVLVYEPMNPNKPVWVDWEDVKRFASEFKNSSGRHVAIRFKTGWSTFSNSVKRIYTKRLDSVRAKRDDAVDERDRLQKDVESLTSEVSDLEMALRLCESEPDGWDDAIDAAVDAVEALRRG